VKTEWRSIRAGGLPGTSGEARPRIGHVCGYLLDLVCLHGPSRRAAWHLELVSDPDGETPAAPTEEDLLVLYLDGEVDAGVVSRLVDAGGSPSTPSPPASCPAGHRRHRRRDAAAVPRSDGTESNPQQCTMRARADRTVVAAVDAVPDEQHLASQVRVVGASRSRRPPLT